MAHSTNPRSFSVPHPDTDISVKLSEVLDDIGVNETMLNKYRRCNLFKETMARISNVLTGDSEVKYYFGSQSEGSTTLGLRSDHDVLFCNGIIRVIQDMDEYKPGSTNMMMVRDKSTPKGYCLLQLLSGEIPSKYFIKDIEGRILLKNTVVNSFMIGNDEKQGPSCASRDWNGYLDFVYAFHCQSWPKEARDWLHRKGCSSWPTKEIKERAEHDGCFVVPTGRKGSKTEEIEWRISTSLSERYLMCSLNITQLKCFVLMKIYLKRIIQPQFEGVVSSYMCKTVLFYCIENTPEDIWRESNMMSCLTSCLSALYDCILSDMCPHFIIPENNLISNQISTETKTSLLLVLRGIIDSNSRLLFGIDEIDNIGTRLQIKYDLNKNTEDKIPAPIDICSKISAKLVASIASYASIYHENLLSDFRLEDNSGKVIEIISKSISLLKDIQNEEDEIRRKSSSFLLTLFYSSLASIQSAEFIRNGETIPNEVFDTFAKSYNSDVSSSKLKLACVLYCCGDYEKAENTLDEIEQDYNVLWVEPVCSCHEFEVTDPNDAFKLMAHADFDNAIKNIVAFCVQFHLCERECVLKELQYEFYRSRQEDCNYKGPYDDWMDCAVIDSLPLLYFLYFKTYKMLDNLEGQKRALSNLKIAIKEEHNFGHKETALNILGQCMEQEGKFEEAFNYYVESLNIRKCNNAAIMHICRLLSNLVTSLEEVQGTRSGR